MDRLEPEQPEDGMVNGETIVRTEDREIGNNERTEDKENKR